MLQSTVMCLTLNKHATGDEFFHNSDTERLYIILTIKHHSYFKSDELEELAL